MIRLFLTVAVAAIAQLVPPLAAAAGPLRAAQSSAEIFDATTDDPYSLSVRAYVWGYPLVRAAQLRQNTTNPENPQVARPPAVPGAPINRLGHQRELSTPQMRHGVAPNNDTLYSLAWLDLAGEPFVLESPDFGNRYYTFQMGQADTTTVQSLGQRTYGGQLPPVFIHGPQYTGSVPKGMIGVRSDQRYFMIVGRFLVSGRSDLPAVHSLQDRIRLRPLSAFAAGQPTTGAIPAQRRLVDPSNPVEPSLRFLEMLGAVLRDWERQPKDESILDSLRGIGVTREHGFRPQDLTSRQLMTITKGLEDGEAAVRAKTYNLGRKINGWSINYAGPRFGDDYLLRAAVAMDQIYIVEPQEALYPSGRLDSDGGQLDGHQAYRIRFSKGSLPPVSAFWSITLYYAKGFMAPNPIDRWAIGDRTPGLTYGEDGSLEILIQNERPEGDKASNWLPAPREPFMLLMRLYLPEKPILDGTWTPPAIERIGVRSATAASVP